LAIPSAKFIFLAVNTPPNPDGSADTGFVFGAVRSLAKVVSPDATIVVKSTVPVGTASQIAQMLAAAGLCDVSIVSNPEFLRQGSAVQDFLTPDRIVLGSPAMEAGRAVAQLFESLPGEVIYCSWASAELAKYAANAFLATRISFINEIAGLAETLGAEIDDITSVLRADPRIGSSYLQAGLGWGGSCFPKDVLALAWMAREAGFQSSIAESAYLANARQRFAAFDRILSRLKDKTEATVSVLGLTFKPNTDDLRNAPAIEVIGMLLDTGISVRAHDPVAMSLARQILPDVTFCENPYEAARDSDLVFLATEWPEYAALEWSRIREMMKGAAIFDGRNILNRDALTEIGFEYLSFGRQVHKNGSDLLVFNTDASADEIAEEQEPLAV
jgi:UDPglucose 6-dehydrogenase